MGKHVRKNYSHRIVSVSRGMDRPAGEFGDTRPDSPETYRRTQKRVSRYPDRMGEPDVRTSGSKRPDSGRGRPAVSRRHHENRPSSAIAARFSGKGPVTDRKSRYHAPSCRGRPRHSERNGRSIRRCRMRDEELAARDGLTRGRCGTSRIRGRRPPHHRSGRPRRRRGATRRRRSPGRRRRSERRCPPGEPP